VSTHRRVFPRPLSAAQALGFLGILLARDEVAILSPALRHFDVLREVVKDLGNPAGNLYHDVHTAALLREHGIPEIITADTDFLQFRFLKVTNPLLR
jgi:predicted nucleic acid-binding protein